MLSYTKCVSTFMLVVLSSFYNLLRMLEFSIFEYV